MRATSLPPAAAPAARAGLAAAWPAAAFVLAAVLLLAAPQLGLSPSGARALVYLAVGLMVVTGLNISLGYAGEMALGQSFLVAVGAYTTGILALRFPAIPVPVHIVLSGAAGALAGLVIGVPGLRLGAWSLAIVTFLTVLILPDLLTVFADQTGGLLGLAGLPAPTLSGTPMSPGAYYVLVMAVLVAWMVLYRNLLLSRWAVLLLTARTDPASASALGIAVYRLKLLVYVVSAVPASVAGGLLALHTGFIGPELFNLERSIGYLAALILGGAGAVYGPIFGTVVVELGPFHTGVFKSYALLAFGALLIIGAVLVPGGMAAAARRVMRVPSLAPRRYRVRHGAEPRAVPSEEALAAIAEPVALEVRGVTVGFGGAIVLDGVSFTARNGITGLIGPNGSGKTTLLNAISGFVPLRAGGISLGGRQIAALSTWRRARAGISRTFQTPRLPKDVLAVEAIAAAASRGASLLLPTMLRLPSWARLEAAELARAHRVAELLGLGDVALRRVAELAAGQHRLIDIGRALMTRPKVLLLDEPAAGLTDAEIGDLRQLLLRLADTGIAVVLIDHNLPFIVSTCSRAVVLDAGGIVYDGPADRVAEDPAVREAYIGVA